MITIIGCNKGGAGKTTTAVNVAIALALKGRDVCLVDADPQRSTSRWYALREEAHLEPNITLLERRDNISQSLLSLAEKYDEVIVDVAGRNSRELITGAAVADFIIAPHQCSQLDLDTLTELQEQVTRVRDINPELKVLIYHSLASTNPSVKVRERMEFLAFVSEFSAFYPLDSIGFYRKIYRDVMATGESVIEDFTSPACLEIEKLVKEVYGI